MLWAWNVKYDICLYFILKSTQLNLIITYPAPHITMARSNLDILVPLSCFLPTVAFFAKIVIDAFGSNVKATSSIVQYSLIILYLAIVVGFIAMHFTTNTADIPNNTMNFKVFLFAMFWTLCNHMSILVLNAMYIDIINRGDLIPSVNNPIISNWVLVPQMLLTFYNVMLFLRFRSPQQVNPPVSWITLIIIALTLIQTYLIVNSFRMMQMWPTDDATRNIPTPSPSA